MELNDAHETITIKAQLPVLRAEFDAMMQDDGLRGLNRGRGPGMAPRKGRRIARMPEFPWSF